MNPSEKNIIYNTKKIQIKIFKSEQNGIYKNVINKLKNPNIKIKPANLHDQHFHELLSKNKLSLRETDELLLYNNERIIVPPKLRISLMQHIHVEKKGHKGI